MNCTSVKLNCSKKAKQIYDFLHSDSCIDFLKKYKINLVLSDKLIDGPPSIKKDLIGTNDELNEATIFLLTWISVKHGIKTSDNKHFLFFYDEPIIIDTSKSIQNCFWADENGVLDTSRYSKETIEENREEIIKSELFIRKINFLWHRFKLEEDQKNKIEMKI